MRGLTGINFIGMDIVEVSPTYDISAITAFAASQLALEYLCLKSYEKEDVV